MAKKLTFPQPVAAFNLDHMKQLVINGADKYPGANAIEDESGKKFLDGMTEQERRAQAALLSQGNKTVYRHLQTGDPLLVNRQPTLHRPSIMAHVARVLPFEKTLRMHYANCKSYNADFDGDEMNVHLPQNQTAISEALHLQATHKQYILPTDGSPIRGLIQDSVVSAVRLSWKDTFLTKEEYSQLIWTSLRHLVEDGKIGRVRLLKPAIWKPKQLWTGKQVVSTIIKNLTHKETTDGKDFKYGLNLTSKSKLKESYCGRLGEGEGQVIIKDNLLLTGIIDKSQIGDAEFGLTHGIYELYGSEVTGDFITAMSRCLTAYLQNYGHTCGLDDLMLTNEFNVKRRTEIEKAHQNGMIAGGQFCGITDYEAPELNYTNRVVHQSEDRKDPKIEEWTKMALPQNPFKSKATLGLKDPIKTQIEKRFHNEGMQIVDEFDQTVKGELGDSTTQVIQSCLPDGLEKPFPKNNISTMVLTGAKGGAVNQSQISVMLGQ